jgi:hypothetical protein
MEYMPVRPFGKILYRNGNKSNRTGTAVSALNCFTVGFTGTTRLRNDYELDNEIGANPMTRINDMSKFGRKGGWTKPG